MRSRILHFFGLQALAYLFKIFFLIFVFFFGVPQPPLDFTATYVPICNIAVGALIAYALFLYLR